jgi:hypothetical protein
LEKRRLDGLASPSLGKNPGKSGEILRREAVVAQTLLRRRPPLFPGGRERAALKEIAPLVRAPRYACGGGRERVSAKTAGS